MEGIGIGLMEFFKTLAGIGEDGENSQEDNATELPPELKEPPRVRKLEEATGNGGTGKNKERENKSGFKVNLNTQVKEGLQEQDGKVKKEEGREL
jgi:hypothetical protein